MEQKNQPLLVQKYLMTVQRQQGIQRRLRTGIPIILWKRMDSGMAGSAMRMMTEP